MEIETLNNRTSYIRNYRLPKSQVFSYDLPSLINKMKNTHDWQNGELSATVLLKSPGKQIMLTVLHDDTEIKSFQSGDSVTFHIIEGKMKFHSQSETIILLKGQIMTLYNKIKFSLTTYDGDSAILLTICSGSQEPGGN